MTCVKVPRPAARRLLGVRSSVVGWMHFAVLPQWLRIAARQRLGKAEQASGAAGRSIPVLRLANGDFKER